MYKNVISILDGAAGSCGKGKLIGEIATDKTINVGASITNCMPNAGHTFVDSRGKAMVFRNIPVAVVNPKTDIFIGPGSALDMNEFIQEYERVKPYLGDRKIYVHELVPLIEERHREYERKNIKTGSTCKGCGAVLQEKIIRDPNLEFFKGYKNAIVCSNDEWQDRLYEHLENKNEYVLMEVAQGCDLSLNTSGNYPYVTSRNVSTTQALSDNAISAERLLGTIMVIRPFPIRISNITRSGEYIYTGDYGTGAELNWTQVNLASNYGTYPIKEEINLLTNDLDEVYLAELFANCPEIYLKQLFGENYKNVLWEKVTPLEALELERLVNKYMGKKEYESKIINVPSPIIIDQSEQTSVTKMERRIFDLDINKLKRNCRENTPYGIYLNFFQHLDYNYYGASGNFDEYYFNRYIREYLDWLEREIKIDINALGTGAKNGNRIIKKDLIRR